MTNDEIKEFSRFWCQTNKYYHEKTGNHLHFPEPILKDLIKTKFGFTDINPGSYDFDNETELKSVTKVNGNTPYQLSEKGCKTIIYCEILESKINVYKISKEKTATIRKEIKKKNSEYVKGKWKYSFANITTGNYKGRIKYIYDLSSGSWDH